MNLALTAVAILAAAICLWAWPALEAEETKRQRNRETAHRLKRLTEEDIAGGRKQDQP